MIQSTLFIVTLSYLLLHVRNRSNFKKELIIPAIVFLCTKYVFGDWDRGYTWTPSDMLFAAYVLAVSYFTVTIKM